MATTHGSSIIKRRRPTAVIGILVLGANRASRHDNRE
jgi:hypothetical protein